MAGSTCAGGWSVTWFRFCWPYAKDADTRLVAVAQLLALTFWGLDGYSLRKSGCSAASTPSSSTLQQHVPAFSMVTEPFTGAVWTKATFSRTLWLFHGAVLAIAAGFGFASSAAA